MAILTKTGILQSIFPGHGSENLQSLQRRKPKTTQECVISYSNGRFETITLTSAHSSAKVSIHLGPKAGVLEGKVTDAVTGDPLRPCVEFRRAANPNNFMSGSGLVDQSCRRFEPADTDVLMEFWPDGYEPWYFPCTHRKSERKGVRLKPGEHMSPDISLQPDAKYAKSGCGTPLPQLDPNPIAP